MEKLSLNKQYYLFKNLSDLFSAGFTIKESLQFLSEVGGRQSTIKKIANKLSEGSSFSGSIIGLVHNDFYNQIMISEKYGDLSSCLAELSHFIEVKLKNKSKIKDLLFYPIVLVIILIGIVYAINAFVLPQLSSINSMQHYDLGWLYIILFCMFMAILIVSVMYKRLPLLRKRDVISRIPFIGKIYKAYMGYILSLELKMLIQNGIDLKNILSILKDFKPNTIMYLLGEKARCLANHGEDVGQLTKMYSFIPTEFNGFFHHGSKVSEILIKLEAFSQIKFEEMNRRYNQLINLIQPLLFLFIGICIVLAYLVVLMPIYSSLKGI
ncbi:Type II secretion system protein F [Apilactobacillus kunkeei]|uniref:type II secretion system F family protein n=1 Tax=Apilactobacillus kunkeei TaxID=148814 RepID=UPI0021E30918|nr:Type II secretion system protein F [Apilactobacillus kunkeei]